MLNGPKRDTIPPIHDPTFVSPGEAEGIGQLEPVLSVAINGNERAYPLRILLWHEIVNDTRDFTWTKRTIFGGLFQKVAARRDKRPVLLAPSAGADKCAGRQTDSKAATFRPALAR